MDPQTFFLRFGRLLVAVVAGAALLAGALVPIGAGATGVTEALEQRLRRLDRDIELSFPRFPERSTILSANGSRLATLFLEEDRKVVRLKRIPQKARRAVLAIEDADFYEHSGVDPEAVGRALLTNVVSGEVEQGASTITQQLARRVVPGVGSEESVARKIREARVAVRLENRYSKDEILELYLNDVYFGGGAYGIATAAQRYFGKRIGKINLREAALLAGTIAAPDRYSPLEDREAARDRRNVVLDRMAELGWVPEERAERAKERGIRLTDKEPLVERPSEAPFFVEYVKRQILNNPEFGQERSTRERVLYQGGLTVHTTLRPPLQRTAQRAAREHLPRPDDPEAALVAIQPGNGAIRALVGGRDFDQKKFDLATQGRRQAGSAFKPFTLVAALEDGISPRERYDGSSPRRIPLPNGQTWEVENAGRGSFGRIDLVQATRQSVNVVYAQLIMDVGPKKAKQAAKRMGIHSELPAVPSLALGTAPVAPLEMASAFGTLANRGVRCEPFAIKRVEDRDGEVIFRHGEGDCERAIPKDISNRVVSILEGVVEGGTGTAASLGGRPVFGKTGTTDDFADAWFVGCTRQLCASTWVGHTEGRIPMRNVHGTTVYGGTFPARIWRDFMAPAMEGRPVRDFPDPPPMPEPEPTSSPEPASPDPEPSPEPEPEPEPEDQEEPEEPQPEPEVEVEPSPTADDGGPEPEPSPIVSDPDPEPSPSPTGSPDDDGNGDGNDEENGDGNGDGNDEENRDGENGDGEENGDDGDGDGGDGEEDRQDEDA